MSSDSNVDRARRKARIIGPEPEEGWGNTATDRAYRACQANGGHHYGSEYVLRDYLGFTVELRVCASCRVPEKPTLNVRQAAMDASRPKGWT